MALNLPPEQAKRMQEIAEDVFGIPRGSIAKDPEAAAILAFPPGPEEAALLAAIKERERNDA